MVFHIGFYTFIIKSISVHLSTTKREEPNSVKTGNQLAFYPCSLLVFITCIWSCLIPFIALFSTCYNGPTCIFVYIYKYIIGQISHVRKNMLTYCERKNCLSVIASLAMLLFHTLLKRDNHLISSHFLLSTLQLALFLTCFQITTIFMISIQPLTYPVSLHQRPNLWDSLSLNLMGCLITLCLSAYLASCGPHKSPSGLSH